MLAAELDRAIREPKDDRLGLQPFADGLAGTLLADDGRTARGVVLGLEGAWGSGKSLGPEPTPPGLPGKEAWGSVMRVRILTRRPAADELVLRSGIR